MDLKALQTKVDALEAETASLKINVTDLTADRDLEKERADNADAALTAARADLAALTETSSAESATLATVQGELASLKLSMVSDIETKATAKAETLAQARLIELAAKANVPLTKEDDDDDEDGEEDPKKKNKKSKTVSGHSRILAATSVS